MYCGWTMSPALGTVDFGNGVTVASNDTAVGIVRFDTDGKAEWASAAGKGNFQQLDASLDGSVLAVMSYSSGELQVQRVGTSGIQTGAVLWEHGGGFKFGGGQIAVTDDNMEVYVTGAIPGTRTLNDTLGNIFTLRSRGSYDSFMLNYDATNGTPTWADSGGGEQLEYFFAIAKDSDTHDIFTGGNVVCASCCSRVCPCILVPLACAAPALRVRVRNYGVPLHAACPVVQVVANRMGRDRPYQPPWGGGVWGGEQSALCWVQDDV